MGELKGQAVDRFLANPDPATPLVLIHGPDNGRVRLRAKALIESLSKRIDDPMGIIELDANLLADQPSRLSEEADSVGMFGERKIVVARLDDPKVLVKPLEALIAAPPTSADIVIVAGDLKKTHPLRSRIEKAQSAMAIACYAADARDIAALVRETAQNHGLSITADVVQHAVGLMGADHGLSAQEIEKLCLFAKTDGHITTEHVDAILVDSLSHGLSDIADAAFAGRRDKALQALGPVLADGLEASVLTQNLMRHAQLLERMRLEIDRGSSADRVVGGARPPIYFKRRAVIEDALQRWSADRLRSIAGFLDEELVQTRLDQRLKDTRVERQVLRIASEALRGGR